MPIEAGANVKSFWLGTSGLAVTKNRPVRLYTSGSKDGDVVAAVTGDDALVIGFAAAGCSTAGYAVPVVVNEGARVLANVNTTVAQGDELRCGAGGQLWDAGSTAANRYVAHALEARTNTGECYVRFEKGMVA